MSLRMKITLMGVNLACLLVTLCYPNSATPFAMIPFIVTVSSWIFTTDNNERQLRGYIWILLIAIVAGAFCIVVGLICEVNVAGICTMLLFKGDSFLANYGFPYWLFVVIILPVCILLSIAEIKSTYKVLKGLNVSDSNDKAVIAMQVSKVKRK